MTRKDLSQFETSLLLTQWLEHSNAPFAMCTDAAASDHLGAAVSGGSVTSFDLGYVPLEFRASAMLRVPLPEFTGDEHVKQASLARAVVAHAVVVILYVARYLMTVTAREHGGEQRECRLQSHFVCG